MTEQEIDEFVGKRQEGIRAMFKWENYPERYTHLVVSVRYDGDSCCIYPQGYLMDDREFETKIAGRKDLTIERVIAYHKGTAKF